MADRYWCHMCSQVVIVNPTVDAEIKCPYCQNGFVEEMSGEGEANGGSSSLREVQDQEIAFGTDRALSQWSPVLLGMMSNPSRRRRFRRAEFGVDNDEINVDGNDINNVDNHHHGRRLSYREHDGEIGLYREVDSIIRRRRRSSAAILQFLQSIREGIDLDHESSNQNLFNQSSSGQGTRPLILIRNHTSRSVAMGDYFVGPGLDHLLEQLAENNPTTPQGTLPARKEAVESLPTVKICEPLQCSVC